MTRARVSPLNTARRPIALRGIPNRYLFWAPIRIGIVHKGRMSGKCPGPALLNLPERDTMKEEIIKVLNEKIRPGLQRDGGDIELVDVDEETGIVQVKLKGACGGCPMATMTMVGFVEANIIKEVPGVKQVVPV